MSASAQKRKTSLPLKGRSAEGLGEPEANNNKHEEITVKDKISIYIVVCTYR